MGVIPRMETHCHSEYSNIRLLDSINKVKLLVKYAREIDLKGVCLTDHECLCGHIELNQIQKELIKEDPNFHIGLGNEIYLTDIRENGIKYYHFILIAKDSIGHRQLRELSSRAWMNSYYDRRLERVPTLKSELSEIVKKNPGHLIATTACLGGEISSLILEMMLARKAGDKQTAAECYYKIKDFLTYCTDLFGEDFYIEIAPANNKEQNLANEKLVEIASLYKIKVIIGCDAHYLKKEDRYIHKAYLNSKEGDREVDQFYEFAYLQNEEQILENLQPQIAKYYDEFCRNSMEIWEKIEYYDLSHAQRIPKVPLPTIEKKEIHTGRPQLDEMYRSDDNVRRTWVNRCMDFLKEKHLDNDTYIDRLEEEAEIKETISQALNTNMFNYPLTLQYYINMMWELGSFVGAGRGSSCSGLNHWALGVTQLDPIKWDLPFWRYLNRDRIELGDIDIDLCPSKKDAIIKAIKKERGPRISKDIDEQSRNNLGCVLVATFGTETTKSTILTACRGYRSEDCPKGIEVETAQFLSSLIPSERGFLWDLSDVLYGNPDKGRQPVTLFIEAVNQYPGLLDIMKGIEGLINKRSSHASGVIFNDEDPYEYGCYMKTPKGELITQWDLHQSEWAGMTKYDFLVTEIQDKLVQAVKFLQEAGQLPEGNLKEVYDKYLYPNDVLPLEDKKIWAAVQKGEVLNIFQFDSDIGSQAIKKLQPATIQELTDANGLMRLMTGDGGENPIDKYARFKNNINLWYQEMDDAGLTKEEQKVIEPYFLPSYGVPPSQEQLMRMLMDENICGFTLKESNDARKIVGKKQMSRIPELHEKILSKAKRPILGQYIWQNGVGPQLGYSFSVIHALAYSMIGYQTAYIATEWNPIYWDTACLIVNSGSLEGGDDFEEDEDGDIIGRGEKKTQTDYAKLAKALGEIVDKKIHISLVDINRSEFGFRPDVNNNQILFGMKALRGVSEEVIEKIISGRPYKTMKDFMMRCPLGVTPMISLIKAGAFDQFFEDRTDARKFAMAYYLSIVSNPKTKVNLQNFNGLLERGIIPNDDLTYEKRIFKLNKILKLNKKGLYYILPTERVQNVFIEECGDEDLRVIQGLVCVAQKTWDKFYQSAMDGARLYLQDHQQEILQLLNQQLFKEKWDQYAQGSISSWEMDALCFYYHEHELAHVNNKLYNIKNFFEMPEQPEAASVFKKNGREIPIWKLDMIAGTVIAKNDTRHSISLLTTNGVVSVKFTKDYYAMFKRQISEVQSDGKKKVMEKGWFGKGTKLLIKGYRREDQFVAKNYKSSPGHQLYKILDVEDNGELVLTSERYSMEII